MRLTDFAPNPNGPQPANLPTAFGHEPVWLVVIKCLVVFVLLMVITILTIWAERRVVARMQQRSGPNRVGPFGVGQGLMDGIKLMLKEDIIPALADKPVFLLAPVLSAIPAFLAFAVVPFGPGVSIAGHKTALQLTDLPVGVLFVLACSSLGVYGIVLAGWSSGSAYPLLGGLRSAAQMISYEAALGLSLVPVFLMSGTLSTAGIVDAQSGTFNTFGAHIIPSWNVFPAIFSFGIYCVAIVGETNRAPFDLPEAESELVGGFHTEYSSIKFALFFLAEYINMVTVSALAVTLFLGGWHSPIPGHAEFGWWPLVWFAGKVFVFLFIFIWLRGTLPRLRYDQFMNLGWKRLIPLSLVHILFFAALKVLYDGPGTHQRAVQVGIIVGILVIGGLYMVNFGQLAADKAQRKDDEARRRDGEARPLAGPEPHRTGVGGRHDPGHRGTPRRHRGSDSSSAARGFTVRRKGLTWHPSLAPWRGFGITFSTMFEKVTTEEYPEYKRPTAPRFHGRHQLNRHPDGLEKCVGCELCAWACPADAIYVEGGWNSEEERYSPGERYGAVYQINYARCIFCGLCIEACPTRALTMTNEYELAAPTREALIYDKSRLLAELTPGMEQPPHAMRLGDDEKDYFVGHARVEQQVGGPQGGGVRAMMLSLLGAAAAAATPATPHVPHGETFLFWTLGPVAVMAALGMVFSRNAVHGALLLVLDFFCFAVFYAEESAPFLAAVQVIVYAGAIMVLFLFVLMLVGVDSSDSLVETLRGQRLASVIFVFGMGGLLSTAIYKGMEGAGVIGLEQANSLRGGNVAGIANLLFTTYVFPFEVISALLIIAAVGAMVLAHKEREEPRKSQKELSRERFAGNHPSPFPGPGVFADHNAVDRAALLPDGSIATISLNDEYADIYLGEIVDVPVLETVPSSPQAVPEMKKEEEA